MRITTSRTELFEPAYRHLVTLTPREAARRIYRHLRTAHGYTPEDARATVEGYARWQTEVPTSDGEIWERPEALDRHSVPLEGLYESVDEMVARRERRAS